MPRAIVAVAAHQLCGFAQHTQFVFDGVRYLGLEVAKPRTLLSAEAAACLRRCRIMVSKQWRLKLQELYNNMMLIEA